jgi:hypothetical protein
MEFRVSCKETTLYRPHWLERPPSTTPEQKGSR